LTSVGYSYWTIAYALSLEGARLLLDARPLTRLLPVDEFLPIMFDAHPNTSWKAVFPRRDLLAYTVHPLIVYPQKYTNQIGYVSDTEDSRVVEQAGETGKDEL
jgi:collagen beta-1,O-galactosyltransferase